MEKLQKLEKILELIKAGTVTFIAGVEIDGDRFYAKSKYAATLIGYLYRAALEEERAEDLESKFLPFPDMNEFRLNPT